MNKIEDIGIVKVDTENAYDFAITNKEAFILLRKSGLGGSDSAALLNVSPFKTRDDLITDKCTLRVTPTDLAIGDKPNVRKGSDLEPLILQKFTEWSGVEVEKPNAMYRFVNQPYLTVNFDGVAFREVEGVFPVEAKMVSQFAEKHWDVARAIQTYLTPTTPIIAGGVLEHHILECAKLYGIPPYYYTQTQQEIMALNAEYGYLAALFDRTWELKVFRIYRDPFVQNALIFEGGTAWQQVECKRKQQYQ